MYFELSLQKGLEGLNSSFFEPVNHVPQVVLLLKFSVEGRVLHLLATFESKLLRTDSFEFVKNFPIASLLSAVSEAELLNLGFESLELRQGEYGEDIWVCLLFKEILN